MQIHGILCTQCVMGCYGIRNLAMSFDSFFMEGTACRFYKQRNGTVDYRNQPWNHNVFAAHSDCCMKFDIFVCVILVIIY